MIRFANRLPALALIALLLPAQHAGAQALDACVFERRERLQALQENGIGLTLGEESGRLAGLVAQARSRPSDGLALAIGALTGKPVFFTQACEGARCTSADASDAIETCEKRGGDKCVVIGLITASCFQQSYFPVSQAADLTRPTQAE